MYDILNIKFSSELKNDPDDGDLYIDKDTHEIYFARNKKWAKWQLFDPKKHKQDQRKKKLNNLNNL